MNVRRGVLSIIMLGSLCMLVAPVASGQDSDAELRELKGEVNDPRGTALPRARIEARLASGELAASTESNSRGEFTLVLPRGNYAVTASLENVAPQVKRVQVGDSLPFLDFTLHIPSPDDLIVVTATRTNTPLSQVGTSATVISGEQMQREGIISAAEALRRIPGLSVVQSGGIGQVTSLFIRGGGSNYAKVLVDGIPVNDPGGSFNFANLSAASIERIEVVRGPQSALFGSDAVAGVIQIFTKRGTSEGLSPSPGLMLEGGNLGTFLYGGFIQGNDRHVDYALSFSRLDTDNQVANGSFNNETVNANIGFRPTGKTEIRAVLRTEAGRSGTPGPWAFERPDLDAFYRFRNVAGGITLDYGLGAKWTHELAYSVSDSRHLSSNLIDSGPFLPEFQGRPSSFLHQDYTFENLDQFRRQRLTYQSDVSLPGGHLVTAGADFERESGTTGDPSLDLLRAGRDNWGGFVQDQWSLKNRLFAAVGARVEQNEAYGSSFVPRASIAVHARQPSVNVFWGMTKLKANIGRGIKEPTLVESFSKSPFYLGNPDLRPEKSVGFDAGIEQQFGARSSLEVTWFDNRYRDQIGFAITDYSTFSGSFFNIGRTRARGVEMLLRASMPNGLFLTGSYTFLDGKVLKSINSSDPVFAEGQQLLRRPRHQGSFELGWKRGRLTFSGTESLVGTRLDSDFSGIGLTQNDRYDVLSVRAVFSLGNGVNLVAAVNNVLNENYMEVLGYPALGRNFRIGLRAGF